MSGVIGIRSFDHAIVAVRDLEAATESTTALLGCSPGWRGVHPGAGTANSLFRLDNAYLELLAPEGEGALGKMIAAALDDHGEGLLCMAFGTDDVAAAVAGLRGRGVAVGAPAAGEGRSGPVAGAVQPEPRHWTNVLLPADATRGLPVMLIEHHSPTEALPRVAPADAAASISALDHVVVMSGDPQASLGVYGDILGLRLALDRRFEARGVRILFFRVGGVTVEVAGALEAGDATAKDRFGGLASRVPDAAAARRRLEAAGFDVSEVRAGHKPGTRVCTVRSGTCGVPTLLIGPDAG